VGSHSLLTSHIWEPTDDLAERLEARVGDAQVGAQDKRWVRAMALVKLARQRNGEPLPLSVLACERLASELGILLGLSVNEVFLCKLTSPAWGELADTWGSLHCLVPEPFQRLDELPEEIRSAIWSGVDTATLQNDDEFRAIKVFDQLILNGDRHQGNVLVSGGRHTGSLWAYFIDHGYAFAGPLHDDQIAVQTQGNRLTRFIESKSTLRAWWNSSSDEEQEVLLPFARKVTEVRDEDVRRLVWELPDEVAPPGTKRFLQRCLGYQINVLREEVD
jgi:hypothetical protein